MLLFLRNYCSNMTNVITSFYVKEASIASTSEINQAIHSLRLWKKYLKNICCAKKLDPMSKAVAKDFHLVVRLLQHDMLKIQTEASRKLILVKDNRSEIQALLSLKIDESSYKLPVLNVCQLVTAPWNLRLRVVAYDKPIHGAATVAITCALFFAKKIGAPQLTLSSTPTAVGFYKKIGMTHELVNKFFINLDKESCKTLAEHFYQVSKQTLLNNEKIVFKI